MPPPPLTTHAEINRAAICSFSLLRAGSRLASAKRRREPGAEAELHDTEKNVLNTYRALR